MYQVDLPANSDITTQRFLPHLASLLALPYATQNTQTFQHLAYKSCPRTLLHRLYLRSIPVTDWRRAVSHCRGQQRHGQISQTLPQTPEIYNCPTMETHSKNTHSGHCPPASIAHRSIDPSPIVQKHRHSRVSPYKDI